MNIKFRYEITAADLWQVEMYNIYTSLAGMCNLVFTAAMAALTFGKWNQVTEPWKLLFLAACLWFPLVHPLLVLQRVRRQAVQAAKAMEVNIDEAGVRLQIGGSDSLLRWAQIKGIVKRPTMLILFSDKGHGYLMPNRVLKEQRSALYTYISRKLSLS